LIFASGLFIYIYLYSSVMCKYSGVLRKGETESKRKRERRKKKEEKRGGEKENRIYKRTT